MQKLCVHPNLLGDGYTKIKFSTSVWDHKDFRYYIYHKWFAQALLGYYISKYEQVQLTIPTCNQNYVGHQPMGSQYNLQEIIGPASYMMYVLVYR